MTSSTQDFPGDREFWIEKGNALRNEKKLEEAIACYDHALAKDPNNASLWTTKGDVLDNLKKRTEAIACYDRALAIHPNFTRAKEK